jgi:radical SAM protein with 4Fe4S-binding SPASM domain
MKKRFKKIYVEITNQCNLSCSFCKSHCKVAATMSTDQFREVVSKVSLFTDHIYLHVMGEPLLHPQIGEFLDIAGDAGLRVNLTTNGTLLDQVGDSLLTKPALRQINISLHSMGGFTRDEDIAAYVRQMIQFGEDATNRSDTIVSFRLWNLESGSADDLSLNELVLVAIKQKFQVEIDLSDLTPGTNRNGFRIRDRLYLNSDTRFEWPKIAGSATEPEGFCYGLRDQVAILCDGTTVPCCLDADGAIALGNIFHEKFEDIIQSERAVKILEGFGTRQAKEELCKRCTYKSRFSQ